MSIKFELCLYIALISELFAYLYVSYRPTREVETTLIKIYMCISSSYIMTIGNRSPVKLLFKKVTSLHLPYCARLQSLCEDLLVVNNLKEEVDRSKD